MYSNTTGILIGIPLFQSMSGIKTNEKDPFVN